MEDSKSKPSPSPETGPANDPQLQSESFARQARTITWDARKLASFKRSYARASRGPESTFTFDGHTFVLGYAKYLIQYLDSKLGAPNA